jgi:hypothetical protein
LTGGSFSLSFAAEKELPKTSKWDLVLHEGVQLLNKMNCESTRVVPWLSWVLQKWWLPSTHPIVDMLVITELMGWWSIWIIVGDILLNTCWCITEYILLNTCWCVTKWTQVDVLQSIYYWTHVDVLLNIYYKASITEYTLLSIYCYITEYTMMLITVDYWNIKQ